VDCDTSVSGNTWTNFIYKLTERLSLQGQWLAGVDEISFPLDYTIEVTCRYSATKPWDLEAFRRELESARLNATNDREVAIVGVHRFSHLVGQVVAQFPGAVYDEDVAKFFEDQKLMISQVSRAYTHDNYMQVRIALATHLISLANIDDMTSDKTLRLSNGDVTVPLHYTYNYGNQKLRSGHHTLHSDTVCTDLLSRNIIKTCYPRGIYSTQYSKVYTKTQYYPVNKSYLEYIRISLSGNRPLKINSGPVLLKIHLKQKR
jgi:hypothetical protein